MVIINNLFELRVPSNLVILSGKHIEQLWSATGRAMCFLYYLWMAGWMDEWESSAVAVWNFPFFLLSVNVHLYCHTIHFYALKCTFRCFWILFEMSFPWNYFIFLAVCNTLLTWWNTSAYSVRIIFRMLISFSIIFSRNCGRDIHFWHVYFGTFLRNTIRDGIYWCWASADNVEFEI